MKIYTKTGDAGNSKVIGGKDFAKSDQVFEAIGSLDELNAVLGFLSTARVQLIKREIIKIQKDLFVIGAYLAGAPQKEKISKFLLARTHEIEKNIDEIDSKLPELKKFILPGGTSLANHLHQARAVCRRTERSVVSFVAGGNAEDSNADSEDSQTTAAVVVYLNRLSDYLYILSRYANHKRGVKETEWEGLNEI